MTSSRILGAFALLGTFCSSAAYADADISCGTGSDDKGGITVAQTIEKPAPKYPRMEANDVSEGWACLEFAVTSQGLVRDVVVVDAMGSAAFAKSAVDAAATWRYKPATYNGTPVEQNLLTTAVSFLMEGSERVAEHEDFIFNYNQGRNHFKAGRLDEAIASLQKALNRPQANLYEQANASYLLGAIYGQKNDIATALFHANHALIAGGSYLSKPVRRTALDLLVQLRAQSGDFLGAREAFAELRKLDANAGGRSADIVAQIDKALGNGAPLVIDVRLTQNPLLGAGGVWRHALLRSKFSFAQISGEVRSFHLSCIGTSHDGIVDQETEWNVPQKAGACMLRVDGAPGATLKFIEE